MVINRDYYLQQLIERKHNGLIKIVTGLRRSGKSFLLFNLFHHHLLESGVDENHIIEVSFDDFRKAELRDPYNLMSLIEQRMTDESRYYIILDEVQMLDRFVEVMNSFMHIPNVDVYVTGSNSRFLSRDIATEFRGRGTEIHLFPLSFAEMYAAVGGDKNALWKRYYKYGGLPQLVDLENDKQREDYVLSLCETVYIKDIIERNKVRGESDFSELIQTISSCVGSPCNPLKLSNTFKSSKNVSIDDKTIAKYLSYMEDSFLVEKSERYDIKGKKYIGTLSKYYFQDIGLRNAFLDFRQVEETHIMENVIYNELRSRGFRVDVGMVETRTSQVRKQLEVDFVANVADKRYYIQSAYAMPDEAKREQEAASLRRIDDSFRKIIIMREDIAPYYDSYGILIVGLMDFLLDRTLLDR